MCVCVQTCCFDYSRGQHHNTKYMSKRELSIKNVTPNVSYQRDQLREVKSVYVCVCVCVCVSACVYVCVC